MKIDYIKKLAPITLKKSILVMYDIFSIIISLKASSFLLYDKFYYASQSDLLNITINVLVFLLIFSLTGQYKSITRYVGSPDLYNILLRCTFGNSLIYLILFLLKGEIPSFKILLLLIFC